MKKNQAEKLAEACIEAKNLFSYLLVEDADDEEEFAKALKENFSMKDYERIIDAHETENLDFKDDLRDRVDYFRHIKLEDQIKYLKKFRDIQPDKAHWIQIEDLLKDFNELSEKLKKADGLENAVSEDL